MAVTGVLKIREAAAAIIHQISVNQRNVVSSDANTQVAMSFNELLASGTKPGLPPIGWTFRDRLHPLLAYVETIVAACDDAITNLAALEAMASAYWKDGAAWVAWVRDLAEIFRETGRNATTRGPEPEELTDFVKVVAALEAFIPEEFLVVPRSKAALLKAVQRALKSPGQFSLGGRPETVV